MARVIIPLSGEAFKGQRGAPANTSAPSTQFGIDESAKALQIASILSGPMVALGSRAASGIAHMGDEKKYKADLAAWEARKSARQLAAESLANEGVAPVVTKTPVAEAPVIGNPPTRLPAEQELGISADSVDTDNPQRPAPVTYEDYQNGKVIPRDNSKWSDSDAQEYLRLSEAAQNSKDGADLPVISSQMKQLEDKLAAQKQVMPAEHNFSVSPGSMDTDNPIQQAAEARVRARAPESAPAPQAPVATPPMPPVAPAQAPATADALAARQAKLAALKAEQDNDTEPFQPMHYDEVRQRLMEAAVAGDKGEMLNVFKAYRKSEGYGVHPESVSDLLTGNHIQAADKELLGIIRDSIKPVHETELDKQLKEQRIKQLQTKNKYLDARENSANKKAADEAIITAARAGNAEAMEAAKLLGLETSNVIKKAEADYADRKFAAATTKAEVEAAHAELQAQLKESLQSGQIDLNMYNTEIKRIEALYRDRYENKRLETMGRPLVTVNTTNKFDMNQSADAASRAEAAARKLQEQLGSAKDDETKADVELDSLKKDNPSLTPKTERDFKGISRADAMKKAEDYNKNLKRVQNDKEVAVRVQSRIVDSLDREQVEALVYGASGGERFTKATISKAGFRVPTTAEAAKKIGMVDDGGYRYTKVEGLRRGKKYQLVIRIKLNSRGEPEGEWHTDGERPTPVGE